MDPWLPSWLFGARSANSSMKMNELHSCGNNNNIGMAILWVAHHVPTHCTGNHLAVEIKYQQWHVFLPANNECPSNTGSVSLTILRAVHSDSKISSAIANCRGSSQLQSYVPLLKGILPFHQSSFFAVPVYIFGVVRHSKNFCQVVHVIL